MKCIFAILITYSLIISSFQKYPDSLSYSTENWMSNLPDDKLVLLINIPGAHDTAANEMIPFAESLGRTQNRTIPELLKFGIRKLDIRVALFDSPPEDIDDNLHTCHGVFDCRR